MDYQEFRNASFKPHRSSKRGYRVISRKDVWKKRIATTALIAALAVNANIGVQSLKNYQDKVNLMQDATQEMVEVGYSPVPNSDGQWDDNYYLLNEIDLIKIYALMGEEPTQKVLEARGTNWTDFLAEEGYPDIVKWRQSEIDRIKEENKEVKK